jgi:superfamily II DNA or RNA helicase
MVAFDRDDILRAVGSTYFQRGAQYQRTGAAVVTDVQDDGRLVQGKVKGTMGSPYLVRIMVTGRAALSGVCSCPMQRDCKHVAALALQVLADQQERFRFTTEVPAPLSYPVSSWLAGLAAAMQTGGEDYPPGMLQRLWYLLGENGSVAPVSLRLRKDGSPSDLKPYNPANALGSAPAKFLRPSDRHILRQLHTMSMGRGHFGDAWPLLGEQAAELLRQILDTGRCRWCHIQGPPLAPGPERPGRFGWRLGEDGQLHIRLEVDGATALVPVAPPHYVDAAAGLCGPVTTGLVPRLAEQLVKAPGIPAHEATAVRTRLAELLPEQKSLRPPELAPPRAVAGTPRPRLLLHVQELAVVEPYHRRSTKGPPTAVVPLARLGFRYDDVEVADSDRRPPVSTLSRRGQLIELHRDLVTEDRLADRLIAQGFARLRHHHGFEVREDCADDRILRGGAKLEPWYGFCLQELPRLRAEGWEVEIAGDFPLRLVAPESAPAAELEPGPGADWFDLHLGVLVDGQRVNILPPLLTVLRARRSAEALAGEILALEMEDGRVLAVPGDQLLPIAKALLDLFGEEPPADGHVRLDRCHAVDAALLEQATAGMVWTGGEALRDMGRILRDHAGVPRVAPPAEFRATLRGYQQDGLDWLQFLRSVGLGGILADDMGLGKTVQVLAYLSVEKAAGRLERPCLVVAPTSLMPNWRREAAGFAPDLRVLVLHGADRKAAFAALAEYDLVLTTYPLLPRDIEVLAAQPWHSVIADEAQFVKNPETNAAKALRRLEAGHRLCLSGTPVENHLGELWSLFDFVSPGLLGDRAGFSRGWRTPIEKKGDDDARARLVRRIRPFLLRRTKDQVAAELPPKTEIIENIAMESGQRSLYESIRLAMHDKVRAAIAAKGLARSRIDFLDALLKLRQVCCDPRLVKNPAAKRGKAGSAKLERLMEMLPELIEEGRRVLLFSQFTSMLDLLEPELKAADIDFVRLTGHTKDRDTPVRRFQAGEVPLFLISLKAGGTGLNLTAADTVIHYDPWWNPAVEAQATDRAHRIGQDKAVFVHKLITEATVEEKILGLQARKAALAAAVFDPNAAGPLGLSDEDVEFLLGEG